MNMRVWSMRPRPMSGNPKTPFLVVDAVARRRAAVRTALVVAGIALAIYALFILSGVLAA